MLQPNVVDVSAAVQGTHMYLKPEQCDRETCRRWIAARFLFCCQVMSVNKNIRQTLTNNSGEVGRRVAVLVLFTPNPWGRRIYFG